MLAPLVPLAPLAPIVLAMFLGGAEALYERARACEANGAAVEAIELYAAVARMDPHGLGETARADERRLRARRAQVELEVAGEEERRGRWPEAMLAAERAMECAQAESGAAREVYLRCAAQRLASAALAGRAEGVAATVLPIPGADPALEAAVAEAFRVRGATLVGPARRSEATLLVRGSAAPAGNNMNERSLILFVLRVEDRAAGGDVVATLSVRSFGATGATSTEPKPAVAPFAVEGFIEPELGGDGRVLQSGARFRLRVRAPRDAHVAVVLLDAQGRAAVLDPGTAKREAGAIALVPAPLSAQEPRWFFLDEHRGTETVYIAASLAPIDDLDGIARDIEACGDAAIGAEILRRRGCAVRRLSIEHR